MTNAKIPYTREDFIEIGARFATEDIIAEIDRLAPLADDDLLVLTKGGYGRAKLDQLLGYRTALGAESAERRQNRGARKASTKSEREARKDGILLLRSGTVLAISAVSARPTPEGEAPETTATVMTDLSEKIDTLKGPLAEDTATVRTRLLTLKGILGDPELRPDAETTGAITETVTEIDGALAHLPTTTETKEKQKQASIVDTADLDETEGRAYWNLKLLTQAGYTGFRKLKNPERAKPYNLKGLNKSSTKSTTTTTTTTT